MLGLCEFEPAPERDQRAGFAALSARAISLRDLAYGREDPFVAVMPFERDAAGVWRASRWIGRFRHDNQEYAIKPRIGDTLFQRIAVDAVAAALLPDGASPGVSRLGTMLDLLPLVWCLALRRAQRQQGIPRLYVPRSADDRVSLRGRLDLPRQLIKNRFAQHHLACRWSELSVDNPLNRVILRTIDHLRVAGRFPFANQGAEFARELQGLRTQLELHGTRQCAVNQDYVVRWTRGNDRYRLVYNLSLAILRRGGAESVPASGEAILLDSAEIWELFLFRRLQSVIQSERREDLRIEWPRERRTAPRMLLEWNGFPTRMLIPDIIVTESDGNARSGILDAKYRRFVSPIEDHDIADQMALYAMTADAAVRPPSPSKAVPQPTMLLLYPQAKASRSALGLNSGLPAGSLGEGRLLFDGQPARLIAWCVPLSDNEANFDQTVTANLGELLSVAFPEG